MPRPRRWSALILLPTLVAGVFATARGQPPSGKAVSEWLWDRSFTVTPQPEPVPALKYRLFPLSSERVAGNAVPIFLRLVHEQRDETRKSWFEEPTKWNDLPADRLPLAEVKTFLDQNRRILKQLELGARRKSAEWNYTFDEGDPVGILLPDISTMRNLVPLLVLQARAALAANDYAGAARAFETGFAFSRHVGAGGFLISDLVAVAGCDRFADRLTEWVARPDAPNLYWSLTALPRPLIDLRDGMDFEQRLMELQFPDLADLDRPRTAGQWDEVLKHIRAEHRRLQRMEHDVKKTGAVPALPPADEPAERSAELPAARAYLTGRMGLSADAVGAMPPAQVIVLYLAGYSREARDDRFKATYLTFPQARTVVEAVAAKEKAAPEMEAKHFAYMLLPPVLKAMGAQTRVERKIAMLRTVEALRLHAAAHGGQLPNQLAEVTAVPVPDDASTGQPFEYRRDGATATIISGQPGAPPEVGAMRLRITVRPK